MGIEAGRDRTSGGPLDKETRDKETMAQPSRTS